VINECIAPLDINNIEHYIATAVVRQTKTVILLTQTNKHAYVC